MLLLTTVLPMAASARHCGRLLKQVVDRHREVVVRRQQAGAARDDAMAVVIGVAGEGDVEAILQADQALHGVRRRRIHADLAVPVDAS